MPGTPSERFEGLCTASWMRRHTVLQPSFSWKDSASSAADSGSGSSHVMMFSCECL